MKENVFTKHTLTLCISTALYIGLSQNSYAVVNGEPVKSGNLPWVAKLDISQVGSFDPTDFKLSLDSLCSGSLIKKNIILTAAHCISGKKISDIKILFPNSNNREAYSVKRTSIHPDFINGIAKVDLGLDESGNGDIANIKLSAYIDNDIAIIELNKNVEGIEPISYGINKKDEVYAAGYGLQGEVDAKTFKELNLHQVKKTIINTEECKLHTRKAASLENESGKKFSENNPGFNGDHFPTKNTLCVVSTNSGTCKGDSGGPLYQIINGQPEVIGVLFGSYDGVCSHQTDYNFNVGIFTSANRYSKFIEDSIEGKSNKPSKNLVLNPYNALIDESWKYDEKADFYFRGKEFGSWKFSLDVLSQAESAEKENKVANTFFGTSYNYAKRSQLVDLVERTGLSQAQLDKENPNIYVSERFTRTYCGGDQYFLKATLMDKNRNVVEVKTTGNKVLEGPCEWSENWIEENLEFKHTPGVRYVLFEDGGKDSEYWKGFYGPRMTGASVRLN